MMQKSSFIFMTEHILHLWSTVESYSKHHFSLSMCQFYLCYVICILINEDIITYVVVNIYIRIRYLVLHKYQLNVLVSIRKKFFNVMVMVCFLNSKNRYAITRYIKCYDSHSSKIIHLSVFYFGSLISHVLRSLIFLTSKKVLRNGLPPNHKVCKFINGVENMEIM